jgi:hypothetical protein
MVGCGDEVKIKMGDTPPFI